MSGTKKHHSVANSSTKHAESDLKVAHFSDGSQPKNELVLSLPDNGIIQQNAMTIDPDQIVSRIEDRGRRKDDISLGLTENGVEFGVKF